MKCLNVGPDLIMQYYNQIDQSQWP